MAGYFLAGSKSGGRITHVSISLPSVVATMRFCTSPIFTLSYTFLFTSVSCVSLPSARSTSYSSLSRLMVMSVAKQRSPARLIEAMSWSPDVMVRTSTVPHVASAAGTSTEHICCVPSMGDMKQMVLSSRHTTFCALWSNA